MMRFTKRLLRLGMTVLLLLSLTVATALAAETATVTVNVTNTPVRGDVRLGKDRLAAGSVLRMSRMPAAIPSCARFFKTAIWLVQCLSYALPKTLWARKAPCSTARTN